MTLFRYTAISRNGDKLAGAIEAVNRRSVVEQLNHLGHLPVDITESSASGTSAGALGGALFKSRVSGSQITLFTRELSMLLKAGLPLDQALELLERDSNSPKLEKLIEAIRKYISDGKSLNEALTAAGSFPAIYTNMVRVAEASGALDAVLERIAETREREQKLRSKALSAIIYPSLLVAVAIGAVIIMMVFVVPRFKQMILHASTDIPRQAEIIIGVSDWLIAHWEILTLSVGIFIFLIAFLWRQPGVAPVMESIFLRLPLIGHIMRLNLTTRFCRTLGTLLENGVELPAAIKLTSNALGNGVAARAMGEAHDSLRKGQDFLEPLIQSGLFPPVVISMLRVGGETGGLDKSCLFMAKMFEEKLEMTVQRTFTILEPVIILFVSVFVAGIIISILGAVISINDLAI